MLIKHARIGPQERQWPLLGPGVSAYFGKARPSDSQAVFVVPLERRLGGQPDPITFLLSG